MEDAPHLTGGEWDNGNFGVQGWLERTSRRLQGSRYGCSPTTEGPSERVFEDPLLNQIYKIDLATFLTAEEISVNGISRMVSLAPDEVSRVFMATQAMDEARHFEVFSKRLAELGADPAKRRGLMEHVTTREMKGFYDLIAEQVDRGDYVAALVAHNVILEGMAYPIYRYEIKYWSKLDPSLSQMIQNVFADEVHHVSYGESYLRSLMRVDAVQRQRIERLARDCKILMAAVFEAAIHRYIGLYQAAADAHQDLMADIMIFPGRRMNELSEEDQVRLLLQEIEAEHAQRLAVIGVQAAA